MTDQNAAKDKLVYILSDGTGQSAVTILKACMIQFDFPPSAFRVFPKVQTAEKIRSILLQAKEDDAFVAFTIAKQGLRVLVQEICHHEGLIHHDILGPPIDRLSGYLGLTPKEDANLLHKVDSKYFQRIEAIEFTMKYDDGKEVKKIFEADIVILGLSRTSKTPTSYLLAQKGYKVVNIPLMPEVPIPEEIYQIDQNRVVCLVMDAEVLQKIRSARVKHYRTSSKYTDLRRIFNEMEMVYDLTRKNKKWHIINTTNKSVEETSSEIINMVFGQSQSY